MLFSSTSGSQYLRLLIAIVRMTMRLLTHPQTAFGDYFISRAFLVLSRPNSSTLNILPLLTFCSQLPPAMSSELILVCGHPGNLWRAMGLTYLSRLLA